MVQQADAEAINIVNSAASIALPLLHDLSQHCQLYLSESKYWYVLVSLVKKLSQPDTGVSLSIITGLCSKILDFLQKNIVDGVGNVSWIGECFPIMSNDVWSITK